MPMSFARFAASLCRVALVAGSAMTSAQAGVMYDAAWVDCDQARDRVTVRYGATSRTDPGATVFWSLIGYTRRPDGDPGHVNELRTARHSCRLSDGLYEVVLRPVPMNTNLQGICGAIVRGSVAILRDGQAIMQERELETGDCAGPRQRIDAITVAGKTGLVLVELAKKAD